MSSSQSCFLLTSCTLCAHSDELLSLKGTIKILFLGCFKINFNNYFLEIFLSFNGPLFAIYLFGLASRALVCDVDIRSGVFSQLRLLLVLEPTIDLSHTCHQLNLWDILEYFWEPFWKYMSEYLELTIGLSHTCHHLNIWDILEYFLALFWKHLQYLDLTIYLSHTCHHLNIWNIFENISLIFIQTLTQVYRVWDAANPPKVKLKIYFVCTTIAWNFITPDICIFCKRGICIFLHQVFAYLVQHATGIWQLLRWKSDSTM